MTIDQKLSNILERYKSINIKLSGEQLQDSNEIVKLNKEF